MLVPNLRQQLRHQFCRALLSGPFIECPSLEIPIGAIVRVIGEHPKARLAIMEKGIAVLPVNARHGVPRCVSRGQVQEPISTVALLWPNVKRGPVSAAAR